jgi:hypothetical protein
MDPFARERANKTIVTNARERQGKLIIQNDKLVASPKGYCARRRQGEGKLVASPKVTASL